MKKMKQRITAGLLMAMMLVVSVCSNVTTEDAATLSAKQYLAKMEKAYSKAKSFEMSQSTSVVMETAGQKMTSKVTGSGIFHFDSTKAKYVQKTKTSGFGQKQPQTDRMYVKKSKGKIYIYTSNDKDGKNFTKSELKGSDDIMAAMGQMSVDTSLYSNAKIVDESAKVGKNAAVKISCQITGKTLKKVIKKNLKKAGLDSSMLDEMGIDLNAMRPIKVYYLIDKKTYRPLKCSVDITAFMNDLFSLSTKGAEEANQSGIFSDSYDMKCTSAKSTVTYKNFNKAKKITYPKGVK